MIVKFRPFRIIDGKVIVTSYIGWHKMLCDVKYRNASIELMVDLNIVLQMDVINEKGEKLFWPIEKAFEQNLVISQTCYDVDGTPTFSHKTENSLQLSDYKEYYQPLTTNIIVREFKKLIQHRNIKFAKLLQ